MITRSGRVSKPPTRYEPIEKVEDDFAEEDYDTEDDGSSDIGDSESDDGSDDGSDLESFIDDSEEPEDPEED